MPIAHTDSLTDSLTAPHSLTAATDLDALLAVFRITQEELHDPNRRYPQASDLEYAYIIAAEQGIFFYGDAVADLPYPEKQADPNEGGDPKPSNPIDSPSVVFTDDLKTDPGSEYFDDLNAQSLAFERNKPSMCKTTVIKMACPGGDFIGFRPMACGKWWCDDCGNQYSYRVRPNATGNGVKYSMRIDHLGQIHARHIEAYRRRVDVKAEFARSYVFTTSPEETQEMIANRKKLDSCIKAVKKIMLGEKGTDGEHEGEKVGFQVHPHGDRLSDGLKIHFNAQVWEPLNEGRRWKIEPEKLARIKMRWKKAKEQIFEARSVANVHYRYHVGIKQCGHLIMYMTRPADPRILDHINVEAQRFLLLSLKKFQWQRYWGLASSSHKEAWADGRKQYKRPILCPVCGQALQVSMAPDREGNLRPIIMTRERLELELEGGYDLIDLGYIWQAVRRQAAEPEAEPEAATITEEFEPAVWVIAHEDIEPF